MGKSQTNNGSVGVRGDDVALVILESGVPV